METLTPKRTNGSTDEPNIVLTRESIFFRLLVFNATFSNISAISWRPVLMMEEAPERTTDHGQGIGKLYQDRKTNNLKKIDSRVNTMFGSSVLPFVLLGVNVSIDVICIYLRILIYIEH
jgi:hypothetical protein